MLRWLGSPRWSHSHAWQLMVSWPFFHCASSHGSLASLIGWWPQGSKISDMGIRSQELKGENCQGFIVFEPGIVTSLLLPHSTGQSRISPDSRGGDYRRAWVMRWIVPWGFQSKIITRGRAKNITDKLDVQEAFCLLQWRKWKCLNKKKTYSLSPMAREEQIL